MACVGNIFREFLILALAIKPVEMSYSRYSPLYNLLQYLKKGLNELFYRLHLTSLTKADLAFLDKLFPYYHGLKPKHKEEFEGKLANFLASKTIIPRGGLDKVSREMELLIGATAVMVTFGFRRINLQHFRKILLYPDNYYSTINRTYHQGEVNPRLGIIVLSWKNFLNGFVRPDDGVNLGIHEMAHALKLENQIRHNKASSFFNPEVWEEFKRLAVIQVKEVQKGDIGIFRESAGANLHEFFAVALEVFFERPDEFRVKHPELYKTLVYLLQQDPFVLRQGNQGF